MCEDARLNKADFLLELPAQVLEPVFLFYFIDQVGLLFKSKVIFWLGLQFVPAFLDSVQT